MKKITTVFIVFLCLVGITTEASDYNSNKKDSPVESASIEAVLLEVSPDALFDKDTQAVELSPESITLPKILACFLEGDAVIAATAKVVIDERGFGESTFSQREYIPTEQQVTGDGKSYAITTYNWQEETVELEIEDFNRKDKTAGFDFSFRYKSCDSAFREKIDKNVFESSFSLKSHANLLNGSHKIVAISRNSQSVFVLILTQTSAGKFIKRFPDNAAAFFDSLSAYAKWRCDLYTPTADSYRCEHEQTLTETIVNNIPRKFIVRLLRPGLNHQQPPYQTCAKSSADYA